MRRMKTAWKVLLPALLSVASTAQAANVAEASWDAPVSWFAPRAKAAPAPVSPAPVSPAHPSPVSPAPVSWNPISPPAAPPPAAQCPPVLEPSSGFYDRWVRERLTIGAALRVARLTDNHRPPDKTFLGNLTALDLENQTDWAPVATYWVARWLRAGLTWERVEARTFNFDRLDPYGPHGQSDGIVEISGPVALLELTWPCLGDTLFPHVGAGVFFAAADFREDTFWHLDYGSPADWEADGRPSRAPHGVYREIRVDDATGWVAAAGLAWRPAKHFQLDLDVRQTWIDADGVFGYDWNGHWKPQKYGNFSLDNTAFALSAAFVF